MDATDVVIGGVKTAHLSMRVNPAGGSSVTT
jgi:hypothetical protein